MEVFNELYWEIGMDFPEMMDMEETFPLNQEMLDRLDRPIYHAKPLRIYFNLDEYGMEGREYDIFNNSYFTGMGILGAIKTFWDEPLTREEMTRIYPHLEPTLDIARRINNVLQNRSTEEIPRSEIATDIIFAGIEPYLDGYLVDYTSPF